MKPIFDRDFVTFLERNINNKICEILYYGKNSLFSGDLSYVRKSHTDSEMISFITTDRVKKLDPSINVFEAPCRTQMRAGKFIRRVLAKDAMEKCLLTDKDIEDFTNVFKAESSMYNDTEFKIVSGNDILKYYDMNKYFIKLGDRGSLWKSCMRYTEYQESLQIYPDNNVRLLVLLSKDDRVIGRALLWDLPEYKIMDRIYYYNDSDVDIFKKWAIENGYMYKYEQTIHNPELFIRDGKVTELKIDIQLDTYIYNLYPYLDTFKFFDNFSGKLYNYHNTKSTNILKHANKPLIPIRDEFREEDIDVDYYDDYQDDDNYDGGNEIGW